MSGTKTSAPSILEGASAPDKSSQSVMVAMSGGVDSAVAALLLQEQGYNLIGATMKLFDDHAFEGDDAPVCTNPSPSKSCCSLDDVEDAKAVARELGFTHYTLNFKKPFLDQIIRRFCEGYLTGLTPNPCIDCNRFLKFSGLHQRRRELGLDYVATGHYARRIFNPETGLFELHRAEDAKKDQTYFLYSISQENLAHTLFPLGNFTKDQVRQMAAQAGLEIAQKTESQDICFVAHGHYGDFLERYAAGTIAPLSVDDGGQLKRTLQKGKVVDSAGAVLGTHQGIARYTLGQRKGIGIAGPEPLYVIGKDAERNQLTLGPKAECQVHSIVVDEVSFIDGKSEQPDSITVKTHYRQSPQKATLKPLSDNRWSVHFAEPLLSVAPGQAAVFYKENRLLGGGTIASFSGTSSTAN